MSAGNLAGHLQRFFTDRLLGQLGASPHTVASYRDTFRLLLKFASKHHRRQVSDLMVESLDAKLVGSFLKHLEHDRRNRSPQSQQSSQRPPRFLRVCWPQRAGAGESLPARAGDPFQKI